MEIAPSRSGRTSDLLLSKKWKDRSDTSPERTKVWTEPPHKHKPDRKVPVVYYLSRNGQLEHPHFMEVPLSSDGLYLRDVINRLNMLRGKAMAGMYSWSSKRSYKNGFVWHDLAENDFIYPVHGQEYILKGSELFDDTLIPKIDETVTSSSKQQSIAGSDDNDFPLVTRRRNQSWSSIDLHEYKVVYKDESTGDSGGRAAADASTQTEDKRRRRRAITEIVEEREENIENSSALAHQNQTIELSRDEISPPPSESSPETLESLMKAEGKLILHPGDAKGDLKVNNHPSGRMKASTVLMQLLTCGSISFKDCGPGYGKDHPGFALISHYKPRLPGGGGDRNQVEKEIEEGLVENPRFGIGDRGRGKAMEDKEYFSGSLIETKKDEFPALKRSSSYNADRSSRMMEVKDDKEEEASGTGSAKCIPRRPKTQSTRNEGNSSNVVSASKLVLN